MCRGLGVKGSDSRIEGRGGTTAVRKALRIRAFDETKTRTEKCRTLNFAADRVHAMTSGHNDTRPGQIPNIIIDHHQSLNATLYFVFYTPRYTYRLSNNIRV